MEKDDILNLAASHGLELNGDIVLNEMGLDFQVAFATDRQGQKWVLRIPRREDLAGQIEREKRILELAKRHLSVSVPDWKIATPRLVAYPLLEPKPVITFDSVTHEVSCNMDRGAGRFVSSLAGVLVELHQIPAEEAVLMGVPLRSPEGVRQEVLRRMTCVKQVLGIGADLEARWRKWVDTDRFWPDFSTFVHGDLYAGHVLADEDGEVCGVIDWSEGEVGDPSVDFSGHLAVFGEQGLRDLIFWYQELGGRVWEAVFEHSVERYSTAPLNYAMFAIETNLDEHMQAARGQLGVLS